MSIAEQCMVVSLSLGVWEGRRLDRGAGIKLTEEAGAAQDSVRVNKLIVPKETLQPTLTKRNALRNHFTERTLPWRDNGDRILPRRMYAVFTQEHYKLRDEFDAEVRDFIGRLYPSAREQASFRMAALYNPDDYPTPEELMTRFYSRLDIDAVSEAEDFRVKLDQESVDQIKEQMGSALDERVNRAMKDLYERVGDAVTHMAEKLGDEESIFRDSMTINLDKLIDALPALNFTNDANLRTIHARMKASLKGLDPKALRQDRDHRAEICKEAEEIMDSVRGLMNAFS